MFSLKKKSKCVLRVQVNHSNDIESVLSSLLESELHHQAFSFYCFYLLEVTNVDRSHYDCECVYSIDFKRQVCSAGWHVIKCIRVYY